MKKKDLKFGYSLFDDKGFTKLNITFEGTPQTKELV